jgi:hypothetical protein
MMGGEVSKLLVQRWDGDCAGMAAAKHPDIAARERNIHC